MNERAEEAETVQKPKHAYEAPRITDFVFEGTAEDAIRYLDGEHAEETIRALRADGLLGGSGS